MDNVVSALLFCLMPLLLPMCSPVCSNFLMLDNAGGLGINICNMLPVSCRIITVACSAEEGCSPAAGLQHCCARHTSWSEPGETALLVLLLMNPSLLVGLWSSPANDDPQPIDELVIKFYR
eukprot:1142488-Pelagomonas_calceolata.AAC.8